jgi:hypothetical protein
MAKEYDLNKTFVQLAGPLMLGGLIAGYYSGIASLIVTGGACYFMLVAVNAIKRGENTKKRGRK